MPFSISKRFDFERYHQRVANALGRTVFFVVGCGKSGTTWTQNLLDAHPQIICRGQMWITQRLMADIGRALEGYNRYNERRHRGVYPAGTPYPHFDSPQFQYLLLAAIGAQLADWGADAPEIRCVGERTPEQAVDVAVLDALVPGARFVHVIRDGRDAAVSAWRHIQRVQTRQAARQYPSFHAYVHDFASAWVRHIEAARAPRDALAERYHEVRYEALHTDPEQATSRLLAFLGVEVVADEVAACVAAASFEAVADGRTPGTEDPGSFYRKGLVGGLAGPLRFAREGRLRRSRR